MEEYLVTCVNTIDRNKRHEGITHLGGIRVGGTKTLIDNDRWFFSKEEILKLIQAGSNTFFTHVNGKRADIKVVKGHNGHYLRTHADGVENDNLLELNECSQIRH